MRLSDQPEYLIAIPAALNGDYDTARKNLQPLLIRARVEGDTATICRLLQVLGDIEARSGHLDIGHQLHLEAVALDPKSPLPILSYAKGLLRAFRQPALARIRLTEAEMLLKSGSVTFDSEELAREWYEKEFNELKQELEKSTP